MATRVDKSNLISEVRNNVVDLLKANVSDPTVGSAEYRDWILSRIPDTKASDFIGFPFIVVISPDPEILTKARSGDGKSKMVAWEVEILIYTSDRGYSDMANRGNADSETIGNKVFETFLDKTNRNTLRANNMLFSEPKGQGTVTEALEETLVYIKSIALPFATKMRISS